MFADLTRLVSRRAPEDYESRFVKSVRASRSPRNRRVERFIAIGWALILVKSALVLWLFGHYRIPVNPLWVIAPTFAFAGLCTLVYLLRD